MELSYLTLFMDKTNFPEEARAFLLHSGQALANCPAGEETFDGAVSFFSENDFSIELTEPLVDDLAETVGLSPYTVWLLLLIEASRPVRETWPFEERLFWDTFSDLRYKAVECKNIHGVWGTFVAFWYPIFYTGDIVKLGRLEYENGVYEWDEPFTKNGFTVKKGDRVKWVHIPSSGEPFDEAARLASYRAAWEHFKDELDGGPLVLACHSWLLCPGYGAVMPEGSNFRGFQRDFTLVGADVEERFDDAWRVFGPDGEKPVEAWPERTSMQRALKKYFLEGGRPGEGRGVLLFDGRKIIV